MLTVPVCFVGHHLRHVCCCVCAFYSLVFDIVCMRQPSLGRNAAQARPGLEGNRLLSRARLIGWRALQFRALSRAAICSSPRICKVLVYAM